MIELFDELDPRDYLKFILILSLIIFVFNIKNVIGVVTELIDPNSDRNTVEILAEIISYEALHQRYDNHSGSGLVISGYDIKYQFEYLDNSIIDSQIIYLNRKTSTNQKIKFVINSAIDSTITIKYDTLTHMSGIFY